MSLYKCKVECLHDWILVRTIDNPSQQTSGGIWIPETAESQPIAQVVSYGPGREPVDTKPEGKIKVGDLVVLQKYTGTKIVIDNKVHMLVKFYDIQGVLTYLDEKGEKYVPELPESMFDATSDRNRLPKKKESSLIHT